MLSCPRYIILNPDVEDVVFSLSLSVCGNSGISYNFSPLVISY